MKKMIFFLGIVVMLFAFISPQVTAADRDVGYAFTLPVDNNVVVSTACQAVSNSPEYVIPVELRDTGSMPWELRAERSGLRTDELILSSTPPPSGCFYDIFYNYQSHSFARIDDITTCRNGNVRIISTSNGGSGY